SSAFSPQHGRMLRGVQIVAEARAVSALAVRLVLPLLQPDWQMLLALPRARRNQQRPRAAAQTQSHLASRHHNDTEAPLVPVHERVQLVAKACWWSGRAQ